MAKREANECIPQRVAADMLAAGIAGVAVTPLVSAVDRALAENASGRAQLWPSFFSSLKEMTYKPISFLRSPQFFWIWLTYSSTYAAANVVDTVSAANNSDGGFAKWVATSSTNTVTCIMKDKAFARMFAADGGAAAAPKAVPMGSYGAWLARDFISMGVFFTLPPIVGREISKVTGSERSGYYAAQIFLPLGLQTITTPIHLLGYDIYNNPNNTVSQRVAFLQKDYLKNVSIRMVRMVAPWSFGTIGNKEMRAAFSDTFVS